MKLAVVLSAMLIAAASAHARNGSDYHLIAGSFEQGRGPDGNSVFLDAPEGLILIDTGRHPAHRDRLLAYARERGLPIAAIVNTHWHLDHTTNNGDIRALYPHAEVYASTAIEGALTGFLARSRAATERQRAAGRIPEANLAEVARAFAVMDHPDGLRPTRPVTRSREMRIAGRRLRVNLAPFAATEGDVWLYDPASRLVIAGDLVVSEVPFLDTACPEGWRRALDAIAATPFTTLIPGHGAPMDRAAFLEWRSAFVNFIDCGGSPQPREACIAGWRRDAARFIGPGHETLIDSMAGYYLDNRLRAAPAERDRYCRPGG
ncbi:MAG TPA: MBL fold metallo-hydrolase [Allosphingosinicella sp.]|nr:MBL fold metallo-hydrolase [Allosphingosinicella sp.]